MPKGKSVYDTYFEAGASMGDYSSSLQKVSDVWSNVDFSREKSAWETERRERNLDTLLAATELVATVGGSMTGFKEGSSAIQMKQAEAGYSGELDWEEFQATESGKEYAETFAPQKIGRGGEPWEKGSFKNLWQSPRYQFGEDVVMSGSEVRKYGRDVKEYGKFGVDLPVDVYKSMHEEYRGGYEKPAGFVEKLGQTIVPGGETGFGDLYSGLGKKLETIPELQTPTTTTVDPTTTTPKTVDFDKPYTLDVDPSATAGTVIPTVEEEEPYKYSPKGVGSQEWFESSLKSFRQKDMAPLFKGSLEKYNPQFQILAKDQGWTGSSWSHKKR
jgi:hypothetical protein